MAVQKINIPASANRLKGIVCLPTKNGMHQLTLYYTNQTIVIPNVGFQEVNLDWRYDADFNNRQCPEISFTGLLVPEEENGRLFHNIISTDISQTSKKKMSLAEIERELGYAIEIVADE